LDALDITASTALHAEQYSSLAVVDDTNPASVKIVRKWRRIIVYPADW
jgi:hypothetical protein